MASIKANRDKDGNIISYRWRACIARDEYGRQQFISKTFKLTEELSALTPKKLENTIQRMADEWEDTQKENKRLNIQTISDKEKFSHFVREIWWDDHVEHNKRGKLAQTTIDYYKTITDQILASRQFKEINLKAITPHDINSYINDLRDKGSKPSTIKHHFDALNTILTYAYDMEYIDRNPMKKAKPVVVPEEKVTRLTAEEITECKEALRNTDEYHCLMGYMFLDTGLRRGELTGLKWEDIDWDNKTVNIRRSVIYTNSGTVEKEPKSRKSKREIPLTDEIMDMLKLWRDDQSYRYQDKHDTDTTIYLTDKAYIFGSDVNPYNYVSPQSITQWFDRFSKRNNLPHIYPHMLRHTFGSVAVANTDVTLVSRYMGHADITTTTKKYVELEVDDLRKVSNAISKVNAG